MYVIFVFMFILAHKNQKTKFNFFIVHQMFYEISKILNSSWVDLELNCRKQWFLQFEM